MDLTFTATRLGVPFRAMVKAPGRIIQKRATLLAKSSAFGSMMAVTIYSYHLGYHPLLPLDIHIFFNCLI